MNTELSAEKDAAKAQAPDLIPVPAECENCGAPLAWRAGVGRYVISHATGDDVCSRATARLADSDREAASLAYRRADVAFQQARVLPPGEGN